MQPGAAAHPGAGPTRAAAAGSVGPSGAQPGRAALRRTCYALRHQPAAALTEKKNNAAEHGKAAAGLPDAAFPIAAAALGSTRSGVCRGLGPVGNRAPGGCPPAVPPAPRRGEKANREKKVKSHELR